MPTIPDFKDISISNYIKQIILDSIFIYYLYTGISLQGIKAMNIIKEEKKLEEERHERRITGMDAKR
jgi:hypothetical protein